MDSRVASGTSSGAAAAAPDRFPGARSVTGSGARRSPACIGARALWVALLALMFVAGGAGASAVAQNTTQQPTNLGQMANPLEAAPPVTHTSPSAADRRFLAHAAALSAALASISARAGEAGRPEVRALAAGWVHEDVELHAALERAARSAGLALAPPGAAVLGPHPLGGDAGAEPTSLLERRARLEDELASALDEECRHGRTLALIRFAQRELPAVRRARRLLEPRRDP